MSRVATTAPLITALGGKPGSVQAAFYHTIVMPLAFASMLLMGISPALRWFRQRHAGIEVAEHVNVIAFPIPAPVSDQTELPFARAS